MTSTYERYAARGRNGWWRYLVGLPVCLMLGLLLGVVAVVVLQLSHGVPSDFATIVQDASRPVPFFLSNGLLFGIVLAGFVLGVRFIHAKRFRDIIGLWSWRSFAFGFAAWCVVLVLAILLDYALAPGGFRIGVSSGTAMLAVAALLGLSVQIFAEEFVFRGYLTQGLLLAIRRPAPAALISGLLFGALHIPNGAPQAVSATAFGVALALIAIRTGGIALTSGLHLANNLFGAVVVASANDAFRGAPALIIQHTPQLMWWDTAVGVVAVFSFAAFVWWRSGRTNLEAAAPASR